MIDTERREAARQFINRWRGKGKEDEDGRSYWIELLSNIFGVENVTERIDFEKSGCGWSYKTYRCLYSRDKGYH